MSREGAGEGFGLDGLRWMVRAADAGSLSKAARRARVSQSTVSRAIARLEASLGVRLFERNGRSFRLTDAGSGLVGRAQSLLQDIEAFERFAAESRGAMRGVVRLSLCTTLGRRVLLPRLLAWSAELEAVTLDVRFEERDLDPVAGGVDIVVRAGRPADSQTHRTVLGDYGHVLVAAPSYLERRAAPGHPDDLAGHATLAVRLERVWSTWPFLKGAREARVSVQPRLVVTDAEALVEAAVRGAGVTVLPDYLAQGEIASGRLLALLDGWSLPRIPVLAFHGPTRRLPRLVRAALSALAPQGMGLPARRS
jgi:DNA-binding transcriptional LysR family regulator